MAANAVSVYVWMWIDIESMIAIAIATPIVLETVLFTYSYCMCECAVCMRCWSVWWSVNLRKSFAWVRSLSMHYYFMRTAFSQLYIHMYICIYKDIQIYIICKDIFLFGCTFIYGISNIFLFYIFFRICCCNGIYLFIFFPCFKSLALRVSAEAYKYLSITCTALAFVLLFLLSLFLALQFFACFCFSFWMLSACVCVCVCKLFNFFTCYFWCYFFFVYMYKFSILCACSEDIRSFFARMQFVENVHVAMLHCCSFRFVKKIIYIKILA